MEAVTKRARPRLRCSWCRKRFKPKPTGRPGLYCSASCRQRAYEKRRWTPYAASDGLGLDLAMVSEAARERNKKEVRWVHMIELLMKGTVPLHSPDQIDGVLDPAKSPERMGLLRRIEDACKERSDETALKTIAHWRLLRQQPALDT